MLRRFSKYFCCNWNSFCCCRAKRTQFTGSLAKMKNFDLHEVSSNYQKLVGVSNFVRFKPIAHSLNSDHFLVRYGVDARPSSNANGKRDVSDAYMQ